MQFRFGIKLTVTMIVFAVAISFAIATSDHLRLREQAIHNKTDQVRQYERMAKYALETIEKAYLVFGANVATKMRENSFFLMNMYERNPNFDEWDFASLKRMLSLDIYIINSSNVVTHSSMARDVGINFSECCRKLAQVLEEKRNAGEFFHDGIDIEQKSGAIKKYSYMPTRDKKFTIELGYSLEEGDIFNKFNFLSTIDELVQNSPSINEVNVLNIGGIAFGESEDASGRKLTEERRAYFERTLNTGQTTEFTGQWQNEPAIYRYVHYVSEFDTGTTQNKVLEIIYNDKDLQLILSGNKKTFAWQLVVILAITVVLSLLISRWVAKPMYLAFHDSLTGLKNRAAFDELLVSTIAKNKGNTAILMIDLDNFKLVNDHLGHDMGDQLLKSAAHCIRSIARKEDITIRLGGDEFVLIMPSASKMQAEDAASRIIEAIVTSTAQEFQLKDEKVTVSIGISLFPEHGADPETLCKKADIALYESKERGKNQYRFYRESSKQG
ncbi:GGDEF domain-containing protein [Paenibacillus contaminans]|uniref:GGDEF domain-containing protein n=1 Tax=Paenibacillus contaminans TaxID=450362 RepID=A0A329MMW5_9BACL|nr:GGDEF domain-containing protein [Paenibacillus contaminans]RAV21229.1 hypothetical protein DQG23_11240 [Paenibacillus contaminans]